MKTLEEKIDVIIEKVGSIDTKVAVQGEVLAEHQRRSLAAEDNLALLRLEFKPVQRHVLMIEGALKFIGVCATLVTIVGGIARLLGLL